MDKNDFNSGYISSSKYLKEIGHSAESEPIRIVATREQIEAGFKYAEEHWDEWMRQVEEVKSRM